MRSCSNESHRQTITVLGGTGRFGAPYIRTFIEQGLSVRILARSPDNVIKRFPQADVRRGSMVHKSDVKEALLGSEAAFLITPVGGNDDVRIELKAAQCAIKAANTVQLPHLIFLSLIQPAYPTGVPMLDVKKQIEELITTSGVPFSSLRTGCYMGTWLSFFPTFMKAGLYLMPIGTGKRFSFTCQGDVARVAGFLVRRKKVLNDTLDIIDSQALSVLDVVNLYKAATRRQLMPVGQWLLPVLTLLRPVLFRWMYPTGASRVRLFNYFNKNDWVGNYRPLTEVFPEFRTTSMRNYLQARYKGQERSQWGERPIGKF